MNKIKNWFKTKLKNGKEKVIKFLIDHPGIEIGIDIIDTIIQKLMLGYAILLGVLLCIALDIIFSKTTEITQSVSPIISVLISALIIPFFLNFCNHRKENEVKQFENNKDLYIELVKILLPIITDKTITKKEKDQLKNYIDEHCTDITLLFSSKMITTVNYIINNCNNDNLKNLIYFSKKLIKQIRKQSGNTNSNFELYKIEETGKQDKDNYEVLNKI